MRCFLWTTLAACALVTAFSSTCTAAAAATNDTITNDTGSVYDESEYSPPPPATDNSSSSSSSSSSTPRIHSLWSDGNVTRNRGRLSHFMVQPTEVGSAASRDAIEELRDNEKVPDGVYAVVRDARDTFQREALPRANELGNALPRQLTEALGRPLSAAVLAGRRGIAAKAPATVAVSRFWGLNGGELPPSVEEILRRLHEKFIQGDLMGFLANALGVDLAYRIGRIILPITTAALRMLVSDLRAAVDHILSAIMSGAKREVWLRELRDLVVKNLRLDTLSMLAELRSNLAENLGELIISAVAAGIQVGAAGRAIIAQLFGDLINKHCKETVEREADRATEYLRKLWDMPKVERLVNQFMSRSSKLLAARL